MIARAYKLKIKSLDLTDEQMKLALSKFKDIGDISDYAKKSAALIVDKKIITGRSGPTFAPKANATRAEGLVMIRRLLAVL